MTKKKKAVGSSVRPIREEEQYARSVFDTFLRARSGDNPQWASDHQDPPDFWLTLGEERIAVEITRLFNNLEVVWNGTSEKRPSPEIEVRGMYLIKEVEREARYSGTLNGTYFLSFPELSIDW